MAPFSDLASRASGEIGTADSPADLRQLRQRQFNNFLRFKNLLDDLFHDFLRPLRSNRCILG